MLRKKRLAADGRARVRGVVSVIIMSKGPGAIETRIGELFAKTQDRAFTIGDLADHAFKLKGVTPSRAQRLSATRAAHRLLQRAAIVIAAVRPAFDQVVADTTAHLGRPPGRRGDRYFFCGGPVDEAFFEAMKTRSSWAAFSRASDAFYREKGRFDGALFYDPFIERGGWRATEGEDRRLYFHPANYPKRVWAVAIRPEGVIWADTEISRITEREVIVRYQGEPARLSRDKLARSWTLYRNVFFTSTRTGYAAQAFDQMWRQRYWRPGAAPPPAMQMPLADAIKLLGVPANFTREDIVAAFRRAALKCHPDHGGTEEQFIELVKARDRLLASLGTREAAPKMPEFAAKGTRLRYGTWRPHRSGQRLGHIRRLTR